MTADGAYAACLDEVRARGWDALHKDAAEHGTRLKGKWEAASGEAWGSEKAKTWRPASTPCAAGCPAFPWHCATSCRSASTPT